MFESVENCLQMSDSVSLRVPFVEVELLVVVVLEAGVVWLALVVTLPPTEVLVVLGGTLVSFDKVVLVVLDASDTASF